MSFLHAETEIIRRQMAGERVPLSAWLCFGIQCLGIVALLCAVGFCAAFLGE